MAIVSRWIWLTMLTLGLAAAAATAQTEQDADTPAKQPAAAAPEAAYVKMVTSKGDIILQLDGEKAPITVANFLQYVDGGHYNGTIFHRVISSFMIQGGGFTPDMEEKPTRDGIKNEWKNGLSNVRGSIAMARTSDPDSASAQFFINVVDNKRLDGPVAGGAGYAVFGRVIEGMDVVDQIRQVATTTKSGHQNVPDEPVMIERVERMSAEEAETMMAEKTVRITMQTSMGDIVLELDRENAPISTENFVNYAKKGHYDGTIFHRVIDGFMIQGGGFTPDMRQKPTDPPIKNEWKNGLKNVRGSIAMARTSIPDSATSQFFINVVDNPFLDQPNGGAAYAVFGRVVEGMDVVDKIRNVKTANKGGHGDVPVEPIVIEKVTVAGEEG